jgi:hypothetical protein
MFHPEHGWMHAYTPGEIESLKANGWEEEKLTIPGARAAPDAKQAAYWAVAAGEIADLAPKKRKPGRPPKAK